MLTITLTTILLGTATAAVGARQPPWQYRWWVWLPDKWQRLGACETGEGKRPGNWHHENSGYVSAFGIQRTHSWPAPSGTYDADADAAGMPHWSDHPFPTPWQQYRTALAHYRLHGGFSGWGCRNA